MCACVSSYAVTWRWRPALRSTYRSSTRRHRGCVPRRRPEATARTSVSSSSSAPRIRASARQQRFAHRLTHRGDHDDQEQRPERDGDDESPVAGVHPSSLGGRCPRRPLRRRGERCTDDVEDRSLPRLDLTDAHPRDSVGGAAGLHDPGLGRLPARSARKTRWTPWKSSWRPDGAMPSKWTSWTSSRSPTDAATPGLLGAPRAPARRAAPRRGRARRPEGSTTRGEHRTTRCG